MFRLLSTNTRTALLELDLASMLKRSKSFSPSTTAADGEPANKKLRVRPANSISGTFNPIKFATAENAAAAVSDPPLSRLLADVQNAIKNPAKGDSVVYWMRMADLRSA
jgi:deoxyribodipyrimidine photo-lyase